MYRHPKTCNALVARAKAPSIRWKSCRGRIIFRWMMEIVSRKGEWGPGRPSRVRPAARAAHRCGEGEGVEGVCGGRGVREGGDGPSITNGTSVRPDRKIRFLQFRLKRRKSKRIFRSINKLLLPGTVLTTKSTRSHYWALFSLPERLVLTTRATRYHYSVLFALPDQCILTTGRCYHYRS